MQEVSPPLDKRGFALFFTGLSGSGKTTINSALIETLQSLFPTRQLTILDGDVVRTHLSKELGFSIPDRNTNIARMGWVAAEVVRHGGIALCSTISPFQESRDDSREFVEATGGGFIVIHISTSVEECAKRDVKGLYQKAMKGMIDLTGVSHPYEFPDSAELTIDAGVVPVEKSVDLIIGKSVSTLTTFGSCRKR
jgi:sulfate adenylyltransferase